MPGYSTDLIASHEAELTQIVERLLRFEPPHFDPAPPGV
jgi:hypothetical protein